MSIGWTITIIHLVIFIITRKLITRQNKKLKIENAQKVIQVEQLSAQLEYYKRQLSEK